MKVPSIQNLSKLSSKVTMSQGKQFIINTGTCVEDMIHGVASFFPGLSIDDKSRVTLQSQESASSKRKVGLLSGGGSGHEPFAAGFVGEGMLTAAVAGLLFASPPPSHILTAIVNAASVSPGGVLGIILNYTGDVLNFGLAIERAKAKGYNVKSVIVDEDCAIDSPEGAGKRGLCGCLFMIKIAGGMATMGKALGEIHNECELIRKRIATIGVTLKPGNIPGLGPMFEMDENSMEVGVGVHGEAGASKMKMEPADKVVSIIVSKLCKTLNVARGDRVCVIVNNLGGTSQLELFLVAEMRGVEIVRQYAGTLMTSLDMAGVHVSMLLLPKDEALWLECLDGPTTAFAWPGNQLSQPSSLKKEIILEKDLENKVTGAQLTDESASMFKKCLTAVAEAVIMNEQKLNELDKRCGDGDTGSTLRRMAEGIIQDMDNIPVKYPKQGFLRLSKLAEEVMGGTSGALYSLMFIGASSNDTDWTASAQSAVNMMMNYSKARVGSRTMFDALIPASESFKEEMTCSGNWKEALGKAVNAADNGCKQTLHYKPMYGRASYVDSSNLTDVDAGAFGVTVWLHAIYNILK